MVIAFCCFPLERFELFGLNIQNRGKKLKKTRDREGILKLNCEETRPKHKTKEENDSQEH